MDINRGNMNTLFTGFKMNFQAGMEQAKTQYEQFATVLTSGTAFMEYPYLERVGGMREWIGDREVKNISTKKLTVKNRNFEDTIAVSANDIADDNYGVYAPLIQDLGINSQNLWGELAVEAILGGETDKWLDDKVFFAADHKYGKSTIANKGTSALDATSYKAARVAMYGYKGANGKYLNVHPGLLLVGPENEDAAFNVLKNELSLNYATVGESTVISGSTKNAWAGTSQYLVLPELGAKWFLLDVSHALRAVIVQKRQEAKLVRKDQDTDDNTFMRNEYLYGTSARGAAALTFPHLIYGSFPA